MAMGWGGDGFYIPRPHTWFSYFYSLSYPYPTGMRNFGDPRPRIEYFFWKKIEVFLQSLEKCCNALFNNMFTLTFVKLIDLFASLNINGSFYNTTIIKQNNMTYQHKLIFCIRNGFEYGSGWVPIYSLPVQYPCFEIGENPNSYPNPIKTKKNSSNWVWFGLRVWVLFHAYSKRNIFRLILFCII